MSSQDAHRLRRDPRFEKQLAAGLQVPVPATAADAVEDGVWVARANGSDPLVVATTVADGIAVLIELASAHDAAEIGDEAFIRQAKAAMRTLARRGGVAG